MGFHNILDAISKNNIDYGLMEVPNEDSVPIAASSDAAWSKPGYGYTYNS